MNKNKSSKLDLLVIGELNMDLILNRVESFPELGKEKIARDLNLTMGSSSAIFAANSSRLGLSVGFCGMVGRDDYGETIIEQLQNYKIDTSLITVSDKHQTGLTVIIRYAGDRAMLTYPGTIDQFSYSEIPGDAFESARHLHISSIFLQSGIKKDLFKIIERAKAAGMTISIDPQWDPDEAWDLDFKKLLSQIDFFFPNEDEFLNITKSSSLDEAINKFQPFLKGGIIVIKQGSRGAAYCTGSEVGSVPGYVNSEPVDTVGAGDSFDAGFIYRFLSGYSIKECIKFGNITGAFSTTAAGGTAAVKSLNHVHNYAKEKLSIDDFAE